MTYIKDYVIDEVRDEVDDDKLIYLFRKNDCIYGKVEIEVLYDSYDYEFINVLSKTEFAKEFYNEPIVKISLVEVEREFRGNGVATKLLNEVFMRLRLAGFRQWFLNASPLDTDGPSLFQLERFYIKYGFKREQLRDESTLMWFKDLN